MPGMIDTHIHASQFPNNGVAMDLPLLEWLQTYTFPTEANFSDTLFAREVYSKVVVSVLLDIVVQLFWCFKWQIDNTYIFTFIL